VQGPATRGGGGIDVRRAAMLERAAGVRIAGRGEFGMPFERDRSREVMVAEALGPLPGALLTITNMENGQSSTQVIPESERTIELPAGNYLVSAMRDNLSSEQQQVSLPSGEARTVELTITQGR
jgi:hypothetical protein